MPSHGKLRLVISLRIYFLLKRMGWKGHGGPFTTKYYYDNDSVDEVDDSHDE